MKTRPRNAVRSLLLLLTALISAVALVAGCSKSEPSEPLPDAAPLLQQSSTTTKAQQSAHLLITVEGTFPELPVSKLEGDLANAPAVGASGKADIIFLGSPIKDVEFVVSDGTLFAALTPGNWQNLGAASEIYDVSAILNPDTGLGNVLAGFSDAKSDGRESINGTQTIRITGKVSTDAVNKIAPQLGATEPVPGTAWVAEDGDHKLSQVKLEPSEGNSITMTTSEWGKPVTVTPPPVSP